MHQVSREATIIHLQLQEQQVRPVTPIKHTTLGNLLKDHPNKHKVSYVIQGFKFGFSLKYNGPWENRQPRNLLSAYQHSAKLWASLMKEVQLGLMLGPFPVQPVDPLICSPVGMVPKRDSQDMHWITHLSYPRGTSINSFISPEDTKTHYQSFKAAVELVAQAGPAAYMAKVPIRFSNLNLLGIKVQGQFFLLKHAYPSL